MPEPRLPGVFVEEGAGPPRQISAVPTSIIGMVGLTDRGPVDRPTLVTSFAAFQRVFGGYLDRPGDPEPRNHLVHAVRAAFEMGAERIHVTRVLGRGARAASAPLTGLPFQAQALHPGQWGNLLVLSVEPRATTPLVFDLGVTLLDPAGRVVQSERFEGLTADPSDPRHAPLVLAQSALVTLSDRPPDPAPLVAVTVALAGGADDLTGLDDACFIGATSADGAATGLQTLCEVDEIGLVAIPGRTSQPVQAALVAHAEAMRYRMAILDSVPNAGTAEVLAQRSLYDSPYAALYHPWVLVDDPLHPGQGATIPPSGHVCGAIAWTDRNRGAHKAPANLSLRAVLGLERSVTQTEQDQLNPHNVNVIRDFSATGRGIRIWGGRTLSSDPEWKYIHVRRLGFLIEKSIRHALRFTVFEPQSPSLWAEVRQLVMAFLHALWRDGALEGQTSDDAYFVHVGPDTMTQVDIDAGRLVLNIGFAPTRPAEFVMIRIVTATAVA